MNQLLGVCVITLLLLLVTASYGMAAWSGFANVGSDNESTYDIRVDVSLIENQLYDYHISVPMVGDHKHCWLIVTKTPLPAAQQDFRGYIWNMDSGRTDILLTIPLVPTETHEIQLTIHKELILQSYVYIDFPSAVLDGGYYYTIDLSSYIKESDR